MTLIQQWLETYGTTEVVTPPNPELCLKQFKASSLSGGRVFIYGAGSVGLTFREIFKVIGIDIAAFFDRDYKNKNIPDTEVLSPKIIDSVLNNEDFLIVASNVRNYEEMRNFLRELGVAHIVLDGSLMHSPIQRSLCAMRHAMGERLKYEECPLCFFERNYCDILRSNVISQKRELKLNTGRSRLPLIGVLLGNMCTLKCDHCVEAIPHSHISRSQEPKEKIMKSIRRLAQAIEFVTVVDFVGGEPFLHHELPDIIEDVLRIENVGTVNVFTNGTIHPSPRLLNVLKRDFVMVNVSDYSAQLSSQQQKRIKETILLLKASGVATTHVKNMTWFDMSSFERNNDSEEELAKRFHNCRVNSCHRLYDGKLFRCLHLYAGYVTGKLPLDETVVDIWDGDIDALSQRLDMFWDLPYSSACRYCELPYKEKLVPSGGQLTHRGKPPALPVVFDLTLS
ncbi:MAG: radical SAM protein [Zoogloeaceae bacterium]|jgi:organic radical activating enzyme|nr:radical SAM protein [Zoogloeaceae bacterium]